ncbi:27564_t:CDS:1, partial [Dentiscutata erythropus]
YFYWKTNIPNTFAIKASQELFPDIDELLTRFLSPTVLKIQQDEIKKALIYQATKVDNNEILQWNE